MKIPEFTAEASLYETSNRYRSLGHGGESRGPGLIPQIGGRGFKGLTGCIMDCQDQHPNWTKQQCARICHDPFGGSDLSTPGNWLNNALSNIGIGAWEGACGALANPMLCGWAADEMRRQS